MAAKEKTSITVKELADQWPNLDGRFLRQLYLMEAEWEDRAASEEAMLWNSPEGRLALIFLRVRAAILPRNSLRESAARSLWRFLTGKYRGGTVKKTADEDDSPSTRNKEKIAESPMPLRKSAEISFISQSAIDRLSQLAGSPLPFYLDAEMNPRAVPKAGIVPHRVMEISIPKAGTYLLVEVLEMLGCEWTKLHLAPESVEDYRQRMFEEIRAGGSRFAVYAPLRQTSTLIRPGQFGVGHLDCNPEVIQCLADFKKIFIYRELRDALISQMRFQADASHGEEAGAWKERPEGPERMAAFLRDPTAANYMFSRFQNMRGWLQEPGVFCLSFESLYGDRGKKIQEQTIRGLHEFLEVPFRLENSQESVARLIGKPTRTWSGKRSAKEKYWNARVEELFCRLGGSELSAAFEYE